MKQLLPFPALVGLETAQQALLLLAVEPRLRGVVLAASAGTGKSSLARGMRHFLGEDEAPFVELPPSVDVENLVGGLDLEATLHAGRMVTRPGLLARADGGVVYADGLNLLSDGATNLLLATMDRGAVAVEREGLSLRAPARFNLIGAYDPAEGQPRRHLLDRVGLLASLPAALDAGRRGAVIRHNLQPAAQDWGEELDFLRGLVQAAREQLPQVTISEAQMRQLSLLALRYGVEGHRVDLFAVWAACAAAALSLRDKVEDEDLMLAARLVIVPRANQLPPPEPEAPPPPEPEPPEPETNEEEGEAEAPPGGLPPIEQLFEALASELPEELHDLAFQVVRRSRSGSRGATEGKRGRHVRSIPGDPRRARIDVVATLRAAAPWQRLREHEGNGNGRRGRLQLRLADVRVKQYRSKAGALFCFAVDASGSMALHRMRQAKGAVQSLLEQAYVNRDRVALIAFRGEEAELLLPPTQSVELARRALDLLPTGGGTPLASAFLLADEVARQAAGRGIMQTVLIVLTDGRGNISWREGGDVQEELQDIGRYISASSLQVVIVDTQRNYLSRGEARRLADWVGGEYAYLPNASAETLVDLAVTKAAREG